MSFATYMPATPPPVSVISSLSPKGAKAIDAYNQYEAGLPARRSAEQLNRLDELRAEVFSHLGDDLFENLAAERSDLLETVQEEVAQLQTSWRRLEELEGLSHWRTWGQRSFNPTPVVCFTVRLGGQDKAITGRELLTSMATTIQKLGV